MAPSQHPTKMEDLPNDVVSNILIRLPAKPLAQMRSVSKSMNALLSQPSFVKSHLHRSFRTKDKILLFFYNEYYLDFQRFTVAASSSASPNVELDDFIEVPVYPQTGSPSSFRVIGYVNGLLCCCSLEDDEPFFSIWNPSLSALLTLPPCEIPLRGDIDIEIDIYIYIGFGFGFDPETDDYKVVKLMCRDSKEWLQVEVYSMRKGTWRIIPQRFPSHVTRVYDDDKVCVDGRNGRLHWLCDTDDKECNYLQTIVAFDLSVETFSEIRLPESSMINRKERTSSCNKFFWLGGMDGKICVMCRVVPLVRELWVMNEYGVAGSWVKSNILSQLASFDMDSPIGFTSDNKLLFYSLNNRLSLYDPNTAKVQKLKFVAKYAYSIDIVEYVESLVWVAPPADIVKKKD